MPNRSQALSVRIHLDQGRPDMTRTTALGALGVALVIGLAGCSLIPGGDDELDWEDSPLSTYLNAQAGMSEEEMNEHFTEQQQRVEELVAECMAEEGFEYVPVDQSQNGGVVFSDDEWDPESREWVEEYGYGAVNFPGRDDQPDPDEQWVDPNQEYVQSLSESEMLAYYETLHGPQPTEEELNDDGSYEYNWETAGCYGRAQHEVSGGDPYSSDEFKPIMEAINEFYMDLQSSPALSDLNAAWSSCMADAGFSGFATQVDAQNSVYDELNAHYENMTEYIEDDPALVEIQEREIELALADLACREETDYRQESLRVQFELEEQFVQEHQSELEALKAALQQAAA
jgi:hypothetical protein